MCGKNLCVTWGYKYIHTFPMAHWWFNPMIFPKRQLGSPLPKGFLPFTAQFFRLLHAPRRAFEGKRGRFFSMGQMLEQVWKIREHLGLNMFPTCFKPSQKFGFKQILYSQFSHVVMSFWGDCFSQNWNPQSPQAFGVKEICINLQHLPAPACPPSRTHGGRHCNS